MSILRNTFGTLKSGQPVTRCTLVNASGASVSVLDLGGIFTSIVVPDKDGRMDDVALGFDTLAPYLGDHGSMGDTVGRYGNRIAAGRFTLDGRTYQLPLNDGENHLHGGPSGFASRMWRTETREGDGEDSLILRLTSPDGDQGYPGTLEVKLTVTWDDACRLTLRYEADTNKPTVVNMTNHTYFNLGGHAHGTIRDHVLRIDSDAVTAAGPGLIPTGELSDVSGTPFDMRRGLLLSEGLSQIENSAQMKQAGGYDQNFCLRPGDGVRLVASLSHPGTGRVMDVLTDQPGMQVYSACQTDIACGKGGARYGRYSGVCLETQHYPDSPNHPEFPGTTVLRPGEHYDTTTIYAFRLDK